MKMRKILFLPLLFFLLLFGCGGRTERMRTLLLRQDSLNRAYVTFTTIYLISTTPRCIRACITIQGLSIHCLLGESIALV